MNDYNDLQRRHGLIVAKAFNKINTCGFQFKITVLFRSQKSI